jgi:hypothetical protein
VSTINFWPKPIYTNPSSKYKRQQIYANIPRNEQPPLSLNFTQTQSLSRNIENSLHANSCSFFSKLIHFFYFLFFFKQIHPASPSTIFMNLTTFYLISQLFFFLIQHTFSIHQNYQSLFYSYYEIDLPNC